MMVGPTGLLTSGIERWAEIRSAGASGSEFQGLAVLMLAGVWNCACKKRRLISFLRKYPDAELGGWPIPEGYWGGSIPLESSFHKRWGGKSSTAAGIPRVLYFSFHF